MEPDSKLHLAIAVGPRTLAMAQGIVHQVRQVLAPDCLPAVSDRRFQRVRDGAGEPLWTLGTA